VLGHLAYIEALVLRRFMLGEENPLAEWEEVFDGAETTQRWREPVPTNERRHFHQQFEKLKEGIAQ
jgi:hypothetical protein